MKIVSDIETVTQKQTDIMKPPQRRQAPLTTEAKTQQLGYVDDAAAALQLVLLLLVMTTTMMITTTMVFLIIVITIIRGAK